MVICGQVLDIYFGTGGLYVSIEDTVYISFQGGDFILSVRLVGISLIG